MKIIKYLMMVMLGCLLTSCDYNINPTSAEPILNKPLTLDSPRYLTQTHYINWINTVTDFVVIERPNEFLPSFKDYQAHTAEWRNWHTRRGAQYRILAVLPAGTKYHFYKIVIPYDPATELIEFHAMIDSGEYKNTPAFYRYNTIYPEDEKFVRLFR
jgi:hypothetical protein